MQIAIPVQSAMQTIRNALSCIFLTSAVRIQY